MFEQYAPQGGFMPPPYQMYPGAVNPLYPAAQAAGGLPPQLAQGIQQAKGLMAAMRGNPAAMLWQNPQMAQVLQMCGGQSPEKVFRAMCSQRGIDPEAVVRQLQA